MKRVVLSLHGIRTRGVWQKDLAPVLANSGFVPTPLDYGNFLALQLLLPMFRQKHIEWLRSEFERIARQENVKRVSIIAHSLGSLIVAEMLDKYEAIKADKVIFAGSIVKQDFDWIKILDRGQVNLIENDYGGEDLWPKVANVLVRGAGAAGWRGFNQTDERIIQRYFPKHSHSDYFHPNHFNNYWIPTLRKTVINSADRKPLVEAMNLAAINVSDRLGINKSLIRSNIFVEDSLGRLSIPTGLHYNMNDATELTVSIPVGAGCTGNAFKHRTHVIAILKEGWGRNELPDDEAKKIHPDLQWICSTVIPDPDDQWAILGILNFDCLKERRDRAALDALSEDLKGSAQWIGKLIKQIQ